MRKAFVVVFGAAATATVMWARREKTPAVAPVTAELVVDAGHDAPREAASEDPIRQALEDEAPYGNDIHRAVCGKRGGCRVIRVTWAGTSRDGQVRQLVTVERFTSNAAATLDPDRDYDDARLEHWLTFSKNGALTGRRWLVSDMDYSYWSVEHEPLKGVVLDPLASTLKYTERWHGLSRFTGDHTATFDFDFAPAVVRKDDFSYDRLMGDEPMSKSANDFVSLRLRHQYFAPNCAVPPKTDPKTREIVGPRPTAFTVEWDAVPFVPGAYGLVDGESIDACSPTFDGVRAGFVRMGVPAPADASFHALLVDDTVVVDVVDDAFVTGTTPDVLEAWTAPDADHGLLRCEPPSDPRQPPTGTAIELATGTVKPLAGTPPPGIRVTRTPGHARVTIPVKRDEHWDTWPAIALVLRDSDDGVTYEREITTTKGFRRKLVELADDPPRIGCSRSNGALVRVWPNNPLRPLLGEANALIGPYMH